MEKQMPIKHVAARRVMMWVKFMAAEVLTPKMHGTDWYQ